MELIKQTTRVGNSAGVLLPKNWLNSTVKVSLLAQPILSEIVKKIDTKKALGIYLTGSHARGEQGDCSDIDVLVITEDTQKHITLKKIIPIQKQINNNTNSHNQ